MQGPGVLDSDVLFGCTCHPNYEPLKPPSMAGIVYNDDWIITTHGESSRTRDSKEHETLKSV